MAFATANRVKDYTTTSGTGSITLAATPPTGFNQFNGSVATGSTCHYCIVDGSNYEIGLGTFTEPTTLARTTPTETKVSGVIDTTTPAAITLSGNSAEVFLTDTPVVASFTPAVIGSSAAGIGTYSTQDGRYSIYGKLCSFYARLIWSAHTGTGNYTIGTVPVAPAFALPCVVYISNITYSGFLEAIIGTDGIVTVSTAASNAAATALAIDTNYTATPQQFYVSGSFPIA